MATLSGQLAALARDLDRAARAAETDVPGALLGSAQLIADAIRAGCPTDTGRTRAGIDVSASADAAGGGHARVTVGAGHDTAFVASLEYGSARERARPFIRPGFDRAEGPAAERFAARIADDIARALHG